MLNTQELGLLARFCLGVRSRRHAYVLSSSSACDQARHEHDESGAVLATQTFRRYGQHERDMFMIGRWTALLLMLVTAGCASEPPAPPADTRTAAPAEPQTVTELPSPPKPWDTMTFDEHFLYMTEHVTPVMAAKFRAYDAERYATFSCETCHGNDMVERKFAMPNPALLVLPNPTSPEWAAIRKDPAADPAMGFMWHDVWPSMAHMLGTTIFNPATRQGIGCNSCHLHEPAAAQ